MMIGSNVFRPIMMAFALALVTATSVSGCRDPGPAEQAGREVDDAVEEARDAIEDLGDEADDALEELEEGS